MTNTDKELLVQPAEPDRSHFEASQNYYSDNVNRGLQDRFYLQVTDYLCKHTPTDLLREDWLANKKRLYNIYEEKCNELKSYVVPLMDMEHELQEILEVRAEVFTGTEFDPDSDH